MRSHLTIARRRVAFLAGTALAIGLAAPAWAETAVAAASDAPASASDAQNGEIIVTARLRSESINRVPVSISALQGGDLAQHSLNELQSISTVVPSVDFRTGASNKDRDVFIRGVGTITTSPGVDPSVSTVIDGVVLARPGQATLDLLDIDRIEVLKGPQGTLFGKNASAGVINVVTKTPTNVQSEELEASYFQGNEYRFRGSVSGPILSDKLLYSVTGLFANYDGNVRNIQTGDRVNGYKRRGIRGKILARPTDNLTLTLGADYVYTRDTVPTGVFSATGRVAYPSGAFTPNPTLAAELAAEGITASPDNRRVAQNFNSNVRDKNYGTSLQADWQLGDYTVTSITAYRKWRNYQHQDYDELGRPTPVYVQGEDHGLVHEHQFSQELRLASPKGGLIDYVVGAYYMHVVNNEVYRRDVTHLVGTNYVTDTGIAPYGTVSDNYALFGEANLNLTKRFRLIGGYRSIWDDLRYYHSRTATAATTGIVGPHISSGSTSPHGNAFRVGAQYDLARDATAYFTFSRGYTGPAYNVYFNMQQRDEGALKPETSDAYEVGLKGSAWDHRLRASIAGFLTYFDNYQANVLDVFQGALVSRLINAGKVSTRGVEGDLSARPIDPLNLSFSFARTNAKIDDFNCPPGAAASCNINGEPLPFAPKWKLHTDANYTFTLTEKYGLVLDTDYSWQSRTQYQLAETADTAQPAYGIWNASLALTSKDGWQLRGLIKNIANKHYSSYLSGGTLAGLVRFVPRDDHRYVGVIASAKF